MKRKLPVIAIDGPAGAGKSTVARALAKRLGFRYVNTGAMYRALALGVSELRISPDEARFDEELRRLLDGLRIELHDERVVLGGRDVSSEIGSPEIGELASQLSAMPLVRNRMRLLQREMGSAGGVVMEGRDIGTVIFPDAEFKVYLDALPEVRARRRYEELKKRGSAVDYADVLEQTQKRDRRDRERALAPLKPAPEALVVDTSRLSVDEVVERLGREIEAFLARAAGGADR